MVEQATHNRQATGSNPVGASFYCQIVSVLSLDPAKRGKTAAVIRRTELGRLAVLAWTG